MVDHQTVSGIPLESCRRKLTLSESWRFVVPIFLHVGIIHLLLNMVAQVTAAAQVEREMGELYIYSSSDKLICIGTIPFLLTYLAGGIYGFVLGGNFSRTGIPSVGASGALFATVSAGPDQCRWC